MIRTSQKITVGNVTAEETTVSLYLATRLGPDGNTTTANIIGQRFVRSGKATIPIGSPIAKGYADVFAAAAESPAINTEVKIIFESLARLAPLLGL
jgi:hypothetical protein